MYKRRHICYACIISPMLNGEQRTSLLQSRIRWSKGQQPWKSYWKHFENGSVTHSAARNRSPFLFGFGTPAARVGADPHRKDVLTVR